LVPRACKIPEFFQGRYRWLVSTLPFLQGPTGGPFS
jgi:hypothetical protein